MKRLFVFVLAMLLLNSIKSQTILAQWTFPTGTANDSLPDLSISQNSGMYLRTEGGTSAIDFNKTGYSTKAAQATGWDNGTDLKCWMIELNTTNYENLKISSRQQSGGNNPGPRDFKLQYRIGVAGNWMDLSGGNITTANDWSTSLVSELSLPDECKNIPSLFIRWVVASEVNSAGGVIATSGISKIDDIIIKGNSILSNVSSIYNKKFSVFPNPSFDFVTIDGLESNSKVALIDMAGNKVLCIEAINQKVIISTECIRSGVYSLIVYNNEVINFRTKLIIEN